jgi:hypothetical protein
VFEINLPGYLDVSDTDGANDNQIRVPLGPGEISTGNDFVDKFPSSAPSASPAPTESSSPSSQPTTSAVPTSSAAPTQPPRSCISGSVKEDIDNDNQGDIGLPNVSITLLNSDLVVLTRTFTSADGTYFFCELPSGVYFIVETNPIGYVDVSDSDGANDNTIGAILSVGQNSTGNDFVDELRSAAPTVSASPTASVIPSSTPSVPVPEPTFVPTTTSAPSQECVERVLIDFETAGDGNKLMRGDYVSNEWSSAYGFTISAFATLGGFTPGDKARIFDTSNPGTSQLDGDPDLGSPHR